MSGKTLTRSQEIFNLIATKKDNQSFRAFGEKTKLSEKIDGEERSVGWVIMSEMKDAVRDLNNRRAGNERFAPEDISFGEYASERWNVPSLSGVLNLAGIDPGKTTIERMYNLPELPTDATWILPEVFLEPIRTGFRRPAMFMDLIRDTVNVSSASITVPEIKMSDAGMQRINEGESIPMGTVEFGGKTGRVFKIGKGFKLTDEVIMFSTVNILAPFLEDLGVKMNMSQNALAINILINGEAAANASSAAVIGVENTTTGFQYRDFLKAHARFDRLNRTADVCIVNEDAYVDIKDMDEVKGLVGTNQLMSVDADIKNMTTHRMRVHGLMPDNAVMFIDKQNALRRLMAKPLMVESERIVSKQATVVYATAMLGFMTFMRDARFIMKSDLAYSSNPFPSWMDPSPYEAIEFAN